MSITPKGHPLSPRDYQDRIGAIRNVRFEAESLFADFHFNPKHALAEQLAWDARHSPEHVGFSHNVQAKTHASGKELIVDAILEVQSVDLVADPATTGGLFESEEPETIGKNIAAKEPQEKTILLSEATLDQLKTERADLVDAISAAGNESLQKLTEAFEKLKQEQTRQEKKRQIATLLAEAGLPAPDSTDPGDRAILDEPFLESLDTAENETVLRERIDARAELIRRLSAKPSSDVARGRPVCRDQTGPLPETVSDARSFAESITG